MPIYPSQKRRRAALISGQETLWKLELVRDRAGQLAELKIMRPHPASGPVVTNVPRSPTLKLPVAVPSEIPKLPGPKIIPKPHTPTPREDVRQITYSPTNPVIVITKPEATPGPDTSSKHPTPELAPHDNDKPPNMGRAIMPPVDWKRTKTFVERYKDPAPPLGKLCSFPFSQAADEKYRYPGAHSIVPFANVEPTQLDAAAIEREIIRFSKPGYKLSTPELYHFQQIYNTLAHACVRIIKAGDRIKVLSPWDYLEPKMMKAEGQIWWKNPSPLSTIHTFETMETNPFPDEKENRLDKIFNEDRRRKMLEEELREDKEKRLKRRESCSRKKRGVKTSGLSVLLA